MTRPRALRPRLDGVLGPPAEERDRAFATLRRDAPVSHHQPPRTSSGLRARRARYWAIVATRTSAAVSRDPRPSAPPRASVRRRAAGDARASQSFLAMDAPRHTSCAAVSSRSRRARSSASRTASATTRGARRGGGVRRRGTSSGSSQAAAAGDDLDMIGGPTPTASASSTRRHARTVSDQRSPATTRRSSARTALWTLTKFARSLAAHRERHPATTS